MTMRTICIQQPAKLSIKQGSLIINNKTGTAQVPLEDIWVLILESHETLLNSSVLAAMNEAGIGVMTCGRNHLPTGLLLPLGAHSRHAAIVENQLSISKPLAKQLWKRIVVAKINNQARALDILEQPGAEKLRQYAREVKSGDSTGREAAAAGYYFNRLIKNGTRRESRETPCLDYGYAVLRAGIAREAVSGGWLVSRGLHHCSDLNAFNLVDDFIEPFRPLIDLIVFGELDPPDLTTESKQKLVSVFEYSLLMQGKRYTAQGAITAMMDSFKRAVIGNDSLELVLPEIMPLEIITGADQ